MNNDQRRALEQRTDTCVMLRSFLTTHPSDRPPERVRSATFEQLTDDLLDAVHRSAERRSSRTTHLRQHVTTVRRPGPWQSPYRIEVRLSSRCRALGIPLRRMQYRLVFRLLRPLHASASSSFLSTLAT